MHGIDLQGQFDKYLLDKRRKITNAHLHSVCKYKMGEETCRYLFLTNDNSFICVKKTPLKSMLDRIVKKKSMTAISDNCEGLGKYEKKEKSN
jgi:hypothetical protein